MGDTLGYDYRGIKGVEVDISIPPFGVQPRFHKCIPCQSDSITNMNFSQVYKSRGVSLYICSTKKNKYVYVCLRTCLLK
jgi:hypothetical protein